MIDSTQLSNPPASPPAVQRLEDGTLEFSAEAVQISILDRRGQLIWRIERLLESASARWDGLDMDGQPVLAGSYTCKLHFADGRIIYAPFVFMK